MTAIDTKPTLQDFYDGIETLREIVPALWAERHCKIVNKGGHLIPLMYNPAQLKADRVIHEMQSARLPVRVVVLKARQLGETTRGVSRLYKETSTVPNRSALLATHDDDSSINVFRRAQLMHKHDPSGPRTRYSTRKELTFDDPVNSVLQVETAGKSTLGRSATYHYVHLSELAFYSNPDAAMLSVSQCVPDSPDTYVCVESTANGVGGYFYDLYCNARRAECDKDNPAMLIPDPPAAEWNGYYRVFNPWYVNPEYRMSAPADFSMSDDDLLYQALYGLDAEQMYWRRNAINSKCGGDEDKFRQEYPANDKESFVVSGRLYFPVQQLERMQKVTRDPMQVGSFTIDGEFIEDVNGFWELFEPVSSGLMYAIGADTAEGLDELETGKVEATDRSVGHVVEVASKRQVAHIRGRMHEDIYAEQLVGAARFFNNARLGVETNNKSGGAVIESLKRTGYDNLFYVSRFDENGVVVGKKIGWNTDKFNRPMMLNDLRVLVRGEDGIPGLIVHSKHTLGELFMFVVNKDGKPESMPGEHDDEVISYAIAIQVALEVCKGAGGDLSQVVVQEAVRDYTTTLAVNSAVDMLEDMQD